MTPSKRKFRWGIMRSTGIKRYIDLISGCKIWRINRTWRIPIDLYPCKVEERMTMKKVGDQMIGVIRRRRIDKEGNFLVVMGKVQTRSSGLSFGVMNDPRIHICCKEGAQSALLLLHPRTDEGDTNDTPTALREVEEEIRLDSHLDIRGTTHALRKTTLIKAEGHFNGQGRWPAKFAKFILDLLKNAESNAEVERKGVKCGGDEKKELLVESRVLIPETTFVDVESRVLIPETTFVGVESWMIKLRSSDGDMFEVDETVALQSQVIMHMIEDGCVLSVIPVPNVTSKILRMVIEYLKKHAKTPKKKDMVTVDGLRKVIKEDLKLNEEDLKVNEEDEALKAFDAEFVQVEQGTLFELIRAANYLNIRTLMKLTCQTVTDMIRGKTVQQIRYHFNIKNDLTPEEEEKIRLENAWSFDHEASTVTPPA
nr:S-phase kinase-associated protein 1-like, SKP1/BTB/POZ domain protein [Tanacetum cinerariifolium]